MALLSRRMKMSLSVLLLTLLAAMSWSIVQAATPTLTVQGGSVGQGEAFQSPIILSEAPNGLSGFNMIIRLSNSSVAEITGIDMPDYGLTSLNIVSSSEAHIKAVDLNGRIERGAIEATLAAINLQTIKRGSTEIQIEVIALDDENGNPIPAELVTNSLSVKKGSGGGDSGTGGGKGGGKGRNK